VSVRVALLLLAAVAGCTPDCTPTAGDAPIVILVTIDTMRADHVGGARTRTPHLDRLAAEGARFTEAYAASSVTVPSHLSMLTSRPMAGHRVTSNHAQTAAPSETLPARLAAAGYRTAGFVGALHLGPTMLLGRLLPELKPFEGPARASVPRHAEETMDRVLDWLGGGACRGPSFAWVHLWDPHMPYAPPAPFDRAYYDGDPQRGDEDAFANAQLDWILYDTSRLRGTLKRHPTVMRGLKRAFAVNNRTARNMVLYPTPLLAPPGLPEPHADLLTAVRDVHRDLRSRLPYNPPLAGFLTGVRDLAYPRALYAGEVSYVDREIGRLRDAIDAWGLAPRTILLVTGDHGEGLGDHGVHFNHVGLWEEMLRVPLIVWAPGRVAPAVRPDVATGLDVAPTLLGLLHLPPAASMEGRDLFGSAAPPPTFVAEAVKGSQVMLREGPWKLVRTLDGVWVNDAFHRAPGEVELYDLSSDPEERTSRSAADPAVVAELSARLDAWLAAHGVGPDGAGYRETAPPVARPVADRLRALGYAE